MKTIHYRPGRLPAVTVLAAALALTACTDESTLAPNQDLAVRPQFSGGAATPKLHKALAQLRRATAPYHNVRKALADGFVLLEECEERGGDGEVGAVYVNVGHISDGIADPTKPDALLYEPRRNGKQTLVGVELVIPYPAWTAGEPPEFFGHPYQREDEFGVFGIHIWIWRHNPNGMFAETNPRVSCES